MIKLLILAIWVSSCSKPYSNLPPKTHEGKNTIGCFVDGEAKGGVFGSWDDQFIISDSLVYFQDDFRYGGSHGTRIDYLTLEVLLAFDSVANVFELAKAELVNRNKRFNMDDRYTLDSNKTNFCAVTYANFETQVLSGLFELNFALLDTFNFVDSTYTIDTAATFSLTNGRFDLKVLVD